jgi:3-oxoacyl-[acyl-carrier protein] reductase
LEQTRELADAESRSRISFYESDLADANANTQMLAAATAAIGSIDILVNNAALHDFSVGALDQTLETWRRIVDINLSAPFQLSQALIPGMIKRGGGAIVNISSAAGIVAGGGGVAYTSTKHALIGLTRQLALEFGPKGVRVNAVCPGITRTPALEEAFKGAGGDSLRSFVASTPARRAADPNEIANVVLFLASSAASFMDGAAVVVDGGYTIY